MACAPVPVSSAGWNTAISVPFQLSRDRASNVVAPTSQVTCMSWPQACITGTVWPSLSFAVTLLA